MSSQTGKLAFLTICPFKMSDISGTCIAYNFKCIEEYDSKGGDYSEELENELDEEIIEEEKSVSSEESSEKEEESLEEEPIQVCIWVFD